MSIPTLTRRVLLVGATAFATTLAPAYAQRGGSMTLATTTSTQDTGLLDSLLPRFTQKTGIEVKPIAVGTGAALEMARRGDADAVLVHAPEAEHAYVQGGFLIGGKRIMHNDFLLLGPQGDPAGVKGSRSAVTAMQAIGKGGSFVSRGDGSGTEQKELALWKAAGVPPTSLPRREETGQGMGATLLVAEQRQTYVLTDRATWLAFRDRLTLVPVFDGDPVLHNVYHAYVVNSGKHPAVRRREATEFVRFLTDPETQAWIGQFGTAKWGQPLFVPDAVPVGMPQPAGATGG
jgi:tungstate transport system substrate-binding protein